MRLRLCLPSLGTHNTASPRDVGFGFTCIEAAEGQNGHVLQAGGCQWFQDREGQCVQGHGDVDHQGMEPAQVQRNGKPV